MGTAAGPLAKSRAMLDWFEENIEKKPVDVFTALDVLKKKKAECQGHSYLYAALSRAAGIPSRVVNGLVYSGVYGGFLYHTWVENHINGCWLAIDPTFGQLEVDATHIRLVEGEKMEELVPLVNLIGKLQIKVLDYE